VQGAANDGVGAVVQRRYVSVPPHAHRRRMGEVVGQLWRGAAVVLCLVAVCSAALIVLENCSKTILEGSSGESKNWPGVASGSGAVVFPGCCPETQEDLREVVDPVCRGLAGAKGVLQAAVEVFYHPV
jgi:hypothetical protein